MRPCKGLGHAFPVHKRRKDFFSSKYYTKSFVINQVFNEIQVIVMLKSAAGGRVCVNFWFPLNNFSLLWLIDTILAVWVAYIKRQLGIATQVSVIKVKVTVTKNRNSVSAQ